MFTNEKKAHFSFYSMYSNELLIAFDCVSAHDVSHKFPTHIHDSLCIGLITKGYRNMNWSDKQRLLRKGDIFVINKNQPHAIDQSDPHDYRVITITGNFENAVFQHVIRSGLCIDLFLQLFTVLKNGCFEQLAEKWNNLYNYLIDNYKQPYSCVTNDNHIKKSQTYIQTNYQQQITVDDIANYVCMSTYHFCRLFKQSTGLSPHNYLRQYRLNKAYKYLQQNTPVFDTAIETGFYDSSHFIKTFYSYMAVSPKAYQNAVARKEDV